MADISKLIEAIAALLWPLFAFTFLLVFKKQIADVVGRLRRGKLLGQEIELDESLKRLDQSAIAVEKEVAELPAPDIDVSPAPDSGDIIKQIATESSRSPKSALILLASEIEKEARQLLAGSGHLEGRKFVPVYQAIEELSHQFGLPRHVPSSLRLFWEARNKLIHGGQATTEDILRAIDSGITILKALQSIPRETNVVYHAGVDIFSDSECRNIIEGAKGIVLETHSPGGTQKTIRIFPSTRKHFARGKRVAWEWSFQNKWGEAWYKHPDSGQVLKAWGSSAEFIGRHMEDV